MSSNHYRSARQAFRRVFVIRSLASGRHPCQKLVRIVGNQRKKAMCLKLFHEWAANGDLANCKRLLSEGRVSIKARDKQRRTALHLASWRGQLSIVQLLLDFEADPNARDLLGSTPVYRAAWQGQTATLDFLLCRGADPNLQNIIGGTPLHAAVGNQHVECVNLLLDAGARVDMSDNKDFSPLHSAAEKGQLQVLQSLIDHGASINSIVKDTLLTALHIASGCGHLALVERLVKAGAVIEALDALGRSPLHYAAMMGRSEVVEHLLSQSCSLSQVDLVRLKPIHLACLFGHLTAVHRLLSSAAADEIERLIESQQPIWVEPELLRELKDSIDSVERTRRISECSTQSFDNDLMVTPTVTDDESLSETLHEELKRSGFTEQAARIQIELAEKLEQILKERWNIHTYLVGSFAEGWGNSVKCMNGSTDRDADIDVLLIPPSRVLHLRSTCRCQQESSGDTACQECIEIENGHADFYGVAANPNQAWSGCPARPSIDSIAAFRCCSYPKLKHLNLKDTKISIVVLMRLLLTLQSKPPHLVAASEPGREGQQLRFSTSFLEQVLIRSLTTVQGHVFIIIKHIVKQALSRYKVQGLKTYHAKTLMFDLLHKTESTDWQAKNVIRLVRRALENLRDTLRDHRQPDCCMEHFFLPGAFIYLKKGHSSKSEIASAVDEAIGDLPSLLSHFMKKLRPAEDCNGVFKFNPFLILPDPNPNTDALPKSGAFKCSEIYNAVLSIWKRLAQDGTNNDEAELRSLLGDISRLPECAKTARCCLEALANLKHGKENEAKTVRALQPGTQLQPFIRLSDVTENQDVKEFVADRLEKCDWAKKFCFVFSSQPKLQFLPDFIQSSFPICILYENVFFLDFEALYRSLSIHYGICDESQSEAWFKETLELDVADLQGILVTLEFCKDRNKLVELIHKHRRAICDQKETFDKVLSLATADPELLQLASTRSLGKLKSRCRQNSLNE